MPDVREATDVRRAHSAGSALARFVERLPGRHDRNLSLVAHSYGTLIAADAITRGLRVDAFVAVGSPGLGLGLGDQPRLDRFYSNSSSLWAARAPNDWAAGSTWWGRLIGLDECHFAVCPVDAARGCAEFRTNLATSTQISGHDSYFRSRSESLRNLARIATGNYDDVSRWG